MGPSLGPGRGSQEGLGSIARPGEGGREVAGELGKKHLCTTHRIRNTNGPQDSWRHKTTGHGGSAVATLVVHAPPGSGGKRH